MMRARDQEAREIVRHHTKLPRFQFFTSTPCNGVLLVASSAQALRYFRSDWLAGKIADSSRPPHPILVFFPIECAKPVHENPIFWGLSTSNDMPSPLHGRVLSVLLLYGCEEIVESTPEHHGITPSTPG